MDQMSWDIDAGGFVRYSYYESRGAVFGR